MALKARADGLFWAPNTGQAEAWKQWQAAGGVGISDEQYKHNAGGYQSSRQHFDQQYLAESRRWGKMTPTAPKPNGGAPSAPSGSPSPISPSAPGAAKVAMPSPMSSPSMSALQGGGGDGGGAGGGGGVGVSGPSKFRQGIGSRIPPQQSQSFAALRQVY